MRNYPDWIEAFQQYSLSGECPSHVLFWAGVAAVSGALQRKVWFDMGKFKWYPNFYIIFVAPPGVISKSITTDTAMELLREVEGVNFGPSVVTWQALTKKFCGVEDSVIIPSEKISIVQSPLTIFSGELGNLIAPNDREMLDTLTNLWDCVSFSKETLKDGEIFIKNPSLTLVACTTPEWISSNLPAYMIGGGLVSRCIMVYADKKRQLSAYPGLKDRAEEERAMKPLLVEDLRRIHDLRGEFSLTKEAKDWGEDWYAEHWRLAQTSKDSRYGGYIARKQTHVHKLAMVLSSAKGDSKLITRDDLVRAEALVSSIEGSMSFIFDQMGKSKEATQADRLVEFVRAHHGATVQEAYFHIHNYFPKVADFDAVLKGLVRSGMLRSTTIGGKVVLTTIEQPAVAVGSPTRGRTLSNLEESDND